MKILPSPFAKLTHVRAGAAHLRVCFANAIKAYEIMTRGKPIITAGTTVLGPWFDPSMPVWYVGKLAKNQLLLALAFVTAVFRRCSAPPSHRVRSHCHVVTLFAHGAEQRALGKASAGF